MDNHSNRRIAHWFLRILIAASRLIFSLLLTTQGWAVERQVLHGHVPAALARLAPVDRLPGTQRLSLAIGLPLRNRATLTRLLQQIYDPSSPQYHQYLTTAQFTELFGPTEQAYEALIAFVLTNGFSVTERHPNRVLLDVNASVADIERALHLTLRVYPHPNEVRTFYAPDSEPSLDLTVPVLDVSGLDNYALPRPAGLQRVTSNRTGNATPQGGSGPTGSYMGSDFRAAYVPGLSLTGTGQVVGLLEFDGYYPNDIASYESQAGLPNVTLQTVLLNGSTGSAGENNAEVALDIEMAISMAPGLSKVIVYEGTDGYDILNRMATDNLAKQLSSSWVWSPFSSFSEQIFQQFAAQGQSFFNASGDSDAYSGAIDKPSDDPYITIVGGTTLSTSGPGEAWVSETVWNSGNSVGSGGGISTSYSLPIWQQGVSTPANQGSSTRRNIPDVAMVADNVWVIYDNGGADAFAGTSCATPLWAGFTALVNQQAVAAGRPAVGFLNPALYAIGQGTSYAACFHDITTGNNTSSSSPNQFFAVAGYDLCTGWGTPAGVSLINALAPPNNIPIIVTNGYTLQAESCTPANGAIDPGETVTVNVALRNTGGVSTTNLMATLHANSGVFAPVGPQVYGVLAPGGAAVGQAFTFTAGGSCGGTIAVTLQLQDGPMNLGTVDFALPLGKLVTTTSLTQNFDAVTAPALPPGWTTTSVSGTPTNWVTSTGARDTAPNAAFIGDSPNSGVNALVSPVIAIVSPSAQLRFRHNYNLEAHLSRRFGNSYFDGGILQIQLGSGAFTEILAAGGTFVGGGYSGTITTTSDNPLPSQEAWVGNSGGWITTTVNLPAAAAGKNIHLRWSCATDTGNDYGGVGWYVDTISLQDGYYTCCYDTAVITTQPANRVVVAGAAARFDVTAAGTPPLAYQWFFDRTNLLAGATVSTLTLTNVQPNQAGYYSVVVTNVTGSSTSAAATLRVLVPPSLVVSSFTVTTTPISISLLSVPGLNYTLEVATSLTDTVWTPLPPSVPGTGNLIILQDTNIVVPPANRYYRVLCN